MPRPPTSFKSKNHSCDLERPMVKLTPWSVANTKFCNNKNKNRCRHQSLKDAAFYILVYSEHNSVVQIYILLCIRCISFLPLKQHNKNI